MNTHPSLHENKPFLPIKLLSVMMYDRIYLLFLCFTFKQYLHCIVYIKDT